ncbi:MULTISPECIES: hypothetical protein [unclassified Bradyrhizobium]
MAVLLGDCTLELKVKGNAVDKSRSKAKRCSTRRFSTAIRSATGEPLLSNRRQRQISFRNHLISLSVSSIEVITDVVVLERQASFIARHTFVPGSISPSRHDRGEESPQTIAFYGAPVG